MTVHMKYRGVKIYLSHAVGLACIRMIETRYSPWGKIVNFLRSGIGSDGKLWLIDPVHR